MTKKTNDETILALAVSRSESIRTTVPIHVARKLGLSQGNRIMWAFTKVGDKWIAVIQKT